MSLKALGKIFFAFQKRFAPDKSFVKNAGLHLVVLIYHEHTWSKCFYHFAGEAAEIGGNWAVISPFISKLYSTPWLWHNKQVRNKMQDNPVFQSHVNILFSYFFTSPPKTKRPESPMITSYCATPYTMPSLKQSGREKCICQNPGKSCYLVLHFASSNDILKGTCSKQEVSQKPGYSLMSLMSVRPKSITNHHWVFPNWTFSSLSFKAQYGSETTIEVSNLWAKAWMFFQHPLT